MTTINLPAGISAEDLAKALAGIQKDAEKKAEAEKPVPPVEQLKRAIAAKLGGAEGRNVANAIQSLAYETVKEAALAASPDFLDPIVGPVVDIVLAKLDAELDKVIERKIQQLLATAKPA